MKTSRNLTKPPIYLAGQDFVRSSNTLSVALWVKLLAFALLLSGFRLAGESKKPDPIPSILVQIKFKPGAAEQWKSAFEEHILPAIKEAIDKGDEILGFSYYETVVSGQPYDFVLIFNAKSFAFFDRRQAYPHYRALFRQMEADQARKLLDQMSAWEAAVTVELVRGYRGAK